MFKGKVLYAIFVCLFVILLVIVSCKQTPATTTTNTTTGATTPTSTTNVTTSAPATTTATTTNPSTTSSKPIYGGTFSVAAASEPTHADPFFYENVVASYIHEELAHGDWARAGIGPDKHQWMGVYYPSEFCTGMLAESWETPDVNTLIFHIRKGIRWQNLPPVNGRELTADDIVYSFSRWYGLGNGFTTKSPWWANAQYQNTTSITALDKYTVEFKHKPSVMYLSEFLGPGVGDEIVAREAVDQAGGYDSFKKLVGTGPWQIYDYVKDSSFTFKKNTTYWGHDERYPENQLPYMSELRLQIIPDFSTQLAALRAGKISVLGMDWKNAKTIATTNSDIRQVKYSQYSATVALAYGIKPFDDIRVRRALQMSVNLKELGETFYGGVSQGPPLPLLGVPGFFTPFDQLSQEVKDAYAYNPEGAKKLLTDAGYPTGFKSKFYVSSAVSTTTGAGPDLALVMQNYFKAINVELEIIIMDPAAFLGMAQAYKMDAMCFSSGAQVAVPLGVMGWYSSNPPRYWNYAQIKDQKFEDLLTTAGSTTDLTVWKQALTEANDYSFAQNWHVNLIPVSTFYTYQSWLGGYEGEMSLGAWRGGDVYARIWDTRVKK